MRRAVATAIALLVSAAFDDGAAGDAIVRSQAMSASTILEVFVEPSVIRLELEIGEPDAPAFANLQPDEARVLDARQPEPGILSFGSGNVRPMRSRRLGSSMSFLTPSIL